MSIPLIAMEEHHQAFAAWFWARQNGILSSEAAHLLHVDTHSDFHVPLLRTSLSQVPADLEAIKRFAEDELTISSFIIPALYLEIFDEVTWLSTSPEASGKSENVFVSTVGSEKIELLFGIDGARMRTLGNADARISAFREIEVSENVSTSREIVLDIDLDYFLCNNLTMPQQCLLEISKECFEEFIENPYHSLRLIPGVSVHVLKKGEQYFADFGSLEGGGLERPEQASATIDSRLQHFESFLQRLEPAPKLILLARSRYSGYTPLEFAEKIEAGVRRILNNRYSIKEHAWTEI